MRHFLTAIAAAASLIALPAASSVQDLDAVGENISNLFDRGFSADSDNEAEALHAFLEIARLAEEVLATHSGLDAATIRDMHHNAANGFYYAAEREHSMARESDDGAALTLSEVDHLVKALEHQKIVFADGQDGLLVAEYYFGTSMLVQHGLELDDPRTPEWSDANVAAGRLRIDEARMMGNENSPSSLDDLAAALIQNYRITGNTASRDEARELALRIPEGNRSTEVNDHIQ